MWGRLIGAVVCAQLLLISTALANEDQPPEQRLNNAESEFRQHNYRRSLEVLRPLLYPRPLLSGIDDVHRARELLGASHWHLDEHDEAEKEWQYLLIQRPGLKLDVFSYPKPLRDYFDTVRSNLIAQGVISAAQELTPDKKQPETVLRITEVYAQRNRVTAFLPFGIPQFEAGADEWGYFFATTHSISALTAISTGLAYSFMTFQNPRGYSVQDQPTAQAIWLTAIISGAAFVALATWGAIDGNARYEKEVLISRTPTLERVGDSTAKRPPQPRVAPTAGGAPQ